jgi:hypothetical protein
MQLNFSIQFLSVSLGVARQHSCTLTNIPIDHTFRLVFYWNEALITYSTHPLAAFVDQDFITSQLSTHIASGVSWVRALFVYSCLNSWMVHFSSPISMISRAVGALGRNSRITQIVPKVSPMFPNTCNLCPQSIHCQEGEIKEGWVSN